MSEQKKVTQFWDMHSGGGLKYPPYHYIYVEGELDKAVETFKATTRLDPYDVECSCCGENYAIDEFASLDDATRFHRRNKNAKYMHTYRDDSGRRHHVWGDSCSSINEFIERGDVLLIKSEEL